MATAYKSATYFVCYISLSDAIYIQIPTKVLPEKTAVLPF